VQRSGAAGEADACLVGAGMVRPDEVGIDTLEDRLRAEVADQDGVQLLPAIVGAWARTGGEAMPG
jgi:hypothetical protein